jgi:large subunit ribosomal protein L9
MKVILLKDISKLGKRGEVKDVSDAYGINVLIKKGDALLATSSELSKWNMKENAKEHKKALATSLFARAINMLQKEHLIITGKKYDNKGQLFAAIREGDITDAIFEAIAISIDPKQITISTPIKSIGIHLYNLSEGKDTKSLKIEIK